MVNPAMSVATVTFDNHRAGSGCDANGATGKGHGRGDEYGSEGAFQDVFGSDFHGIVFFDCS
jgi:hypothetical protein